MAKTASKAATKKALPQSKADLLERFKDYPGIKAFERALESPEGPGSLPILLVDEDPHACVDTGHQQALKVGAVRCHLCGRPARKWYLRHVNTKQEGRVASVKARGLVPVQFAELAQPDEIANLVTSTDGLVHTGTNGAKVLYKIPLDLYNLRKRAERDSRQRRQANPKRVREDLANDAGRASGLGAEAADTIYRDLEYSEKKIHTTLQEEAAGVGVDD